ncbi:MAG TPA: YpjP family protein [Virgibacillus sp.]|nr:YpjP family protein [Virgibacillus sp.]
MRLWFRKIFAIFLVIMTFGMYVPPVYPTTHAEENKESIDSKSAFNEAEPPAVVKVIDDFSIGPHHIEEENDYDVITNKAKKQVLTKLGPKIAEQVEEEFLTMILPTMEEALQHILTDIGEEDATYIGITEQLSTGYGEKIFHVYDYRTKNDIARFHVRRDNRPLEGYWFNFHYHLYDDNFEKHYEIGEIYWDKNIPPKWMSS